MRNLHPLVAACLSLAACSKTPPPAADITIVTDAAASPTDASLAETVTPKVAVVPADVAAMQAEAGAPLPDGAVLRLGAARPFAVRDLDQLALSADGARLATVPIYASQVTIWSTTTGVVERTLDASRDEHVNGLAFAPDDGRLAVIAHDELVLYAPDGAELWRTAPKPAGPGKNPAFLRAVAFSPDGKIVAVGHNQSAVGLLDAATGKPMKTLVGKGTAFASLAFSPDGASIAATGMGEAGHSELRVWSVARGKSILDHTLASTAEDASFAYAVGLMWLADGRLLTSTNGGALVVWKPGEAKPVGVGDNAIGARELAGSTVPFAILLGGQVAVLDPTSFASGSLIAVPGVDSVDLIASAGTLVAVGDEVGARLLDHTPEGLVERFPTRGHDARVDALAWGPDGTWLATGGDDARVRIWSANNGREVRVIPIAEPSVRALAIGPGATDGLVAVATGGLDRMTATDGALRLLRPDGEELRSVPVRGGATAVAFSDDGKRVAVGGHAGRLVIYDVATLAEVSHYDHEGVVRDLAWLDARRIGAALGGDVAVWHMPSGDPALATSRSAPGGRDVLLALARGGDADHVLTAGYSYGAVTIWDLTKASEDEPRRVGVDGADARETIVRALATSPDGTRFAAGDDHGVVRVFELGSPDAAPRSFAGHTHPVTRVAFSPDGKRLATASLDRTVLVFATP